MWDFGVMYENVDWTRQGSAIIEKVLTQSVEDNLSLILPVFH